VTADRQSALKVKRPRQLTRHHQPAEAHQRRVRLADQDPSERSATLTVITLRVITINFAGSPYHPASVSYESDGKPRTRGVFSINLRRFTPH
jgi:hypothetical protein